MVTKDSLAVAVARQSGCPMKVAKSNVEAVLRAIRQGIITEGSLELRGLFTAKVATVGPYQGRNPRTGVSVEVPARKTVKFKISTLLKKAL